MGNVLALDQAKTSGYAIFSPTGKLLSHGHKTFADNVLQYTFFAHLLVEHNITTLLIENIQLQRNVQTFKTLAQLQGIFMALAHNHNIELYIISSNSWRSKVGLRGRNRTALKHAAVQLVYELYGIKATQDQAEAILIGHSYMLDKTSAF